MTNFKQRFHKFLKTKWQIVGILLLVLLSVFLLWFSNSKSTQASSVLMAQVKFEGEYRVADGPWREIVEGEHISATRGEVTLRGNFHMYAPDGTYAGIYRGSLPIAFYTNHISLTFREGDAVPHVLDVENPLYGPSACGKIWAAYTFTSDSEDPIEILVHNPHAYGNETAIDEMLAGVALWAGIDFEKGVLDSGGLQRDVGLLFVIVSLMLLGIALFSTLIHIKNTRLIWVLGTIVLFAGIYFAYSADGVAFWSESVVSNTTILGASMMFYMLFVSMIIAAFLKGSKKIVNITLLLLAVADAVFFALPIVAGVFFYDTWTWWIAVQVAANTVLAACLIKEFVTVRKKERWFCIGAFLPIVSFAADVVGTWIGAWNGGVVSQYVFVVLFAVTMVMILKLVPQNINAAAKAKELEMERVALNAKLAESRISTMMSQIRPHFIYNTLGSIEQLCIIDPAKAGELVHNFAKYLRGNFGELDNPKPILMSREMEHVRHYVSIENVRFPDMTFTFEMNSEDFNIPALTIQPIVENAIKHGLMKLPRGGTIHVVSYETETDYCISVVDDGVGFDTSALLDDRKHVGLRNIRERLKVMVNGTLEIESAVGEGTKVRITIPKEGRK
ncbi:MAG: histidine kinase [Clostridia bacterium]|nr:histidine kinase [Clostridia bacterium]